MTPAFLTRRLALLGGLAALAGCDAVSALNTASQPLDTFDLLPVSGATGGRRNAHTLLIARPQAPAAIASDRIMVKPGPAAITYLPAARWSDEAPLVVQSLLVRSIAGTGRIGYVGPVEGGPVPDTALLVRIDAFQVNEQPDGTLAVAVDLALSVMDDREQRVIAARRFAGGAAVGGDSPAAIVAGFQAVLNDLLPAMADWAVANA